MEKINEGGETEKIVIPRNITIKQFTEKYLPLDLFEGRILDYFEKNRDGEADGDAKKIILSMESAEDKIFMDFLEENDLLKDEFLSGLPIKFEER